MIEGLTDKANESAAGFKQSRSREALVSWVMSHVDEWEDYRKNNYDQKWAEYYRKWKGQWDDNDKTRSSERSKLITPLLQQAVEESVAEIEEAIFGDKEGWFDLDDNVVDPVKEEWQAVRLQVLDDMDYCNAPPSVIECVLNSAIYGTGIGKVVTDATEYKTLQTRVDVLSGEMAEGVQETERVVVHLEPVLPTQFVIDTAVTRQGEEGIKQALGMAHILSRPRHSIRAKIEDGVYWEVPLLELDGSDNNNEADDEEANLVVEYHGLVPKRLLENAVNDSEKTDDYDSREMVESVITIVDRKWLAKARKNENVKGDRDFVAFPWGIVPGSFFGKGVCEEGINSQKALDSMLRAQIDGMAYTIHPMLGVNMQRRDPRHKIEVAPGKILYTNGNPAEALMPLRFGNIDAASFRLSGELERLLQIGTGTAGGASSMSSNAAQTTLGGMSVVAGRLAKQAKRTLRFVERYFLIPFITKFTLRHMQYNGEVYPFIDLRFRVRTSLGLTAREVENNTIATILQTVPPESPVFYALLSQIVQNSSMKDKGMVLALIQGVINGQVPGSSQQEPSPLQQEREAADLNEVVARTRLKEATTAEKVQKIANFRTESGTANAK